MPLCGAMLRTWVCVSVSCYLLSILTHVAYTHVTAACPAAASVCGTPQGSPRSVHYTCIDNLAMLRDLESDRPRHLRQQAPPPP
ncbi:hypothetical protein BD626DRAFT_471740 [Schizophyllum amplum]|uniref:Secreted protein n=1 Tax=Schizophyllum amplum TaxID=97359 RepID=A0A550CVE9_9AGAR|nr:hypothetical protein BD626DRAFT_471740 [Auriculariopsis ampla]